MVAGQSNILINFPPFSKVVSAILNFCKKIIIKQRNALQPIQFIKTTKTEQELKVDKTSLSHYQYYDKSNITIGDSVKILKL